MRRGTTSLAPEIKCPRQRTRYVAQLNALSRPLEGGRSKPTNPLIPAHDTVTKLVGIGGEAADLL